MDDLTYKERLRYLEASMDVQATILSNIQAELIEADRLSNSVDRLGVGASELGEALLQVDKNQQTLTRLGQQLDDVENKADTAKQAVAVKAAEHRRTRHRLIAAALIGFAVVAAALLFLSTSAHEACERRQEATLVDIAVLESFKNGRNDGHLQEGIDRYRATLDRNCDEQYPLHFP